MTSGAHPPEVEARQQLVTGLLTWLLALDSEAQWSERVMSVQPLTSGAVAYELVERRIDGERRETDVLPDAVADAVRTLQQYMYTPTGGAWLTAHLSVTAAGQGDVRFNYAEEPRIPGPDGASAGMSGEDVAAHLQVFPRPAQAVPDWMRRRTGEG